MSTQRHDMYRAQLPQDRQLVRCSCGFSKKSAQTFEQIERDHMDEVSLVPAN